MTRYLSLAEVLELHARLLSSSGGGDGVRDWGALESALGEAAAGGSRVRREHFFPESGESAAMEPLTTMSAPDRTQLPHLLALLDDESPVVHESVLGKLAEFGGGLIGELQRLPDPPSESRLRRLLGLLDQYRGRVQEFYQESMEGPVIRSVLFQPGELVRHRRYGYRGLIADRDLRCAASQGWYLHNRTRPRRDQPWYHVLVHGSDAVTYAAQTSLLPDESAAEICHVLVPHFFERFESGHYIRNATEWPRQQ